MGHTVVRRQFCDCPAGERQLTAFTEARAAADRAKAREEMITAYRTANLLPWEIAQKFGGVPTIKTFESYHTRKGIAVERPPNMNLNKLILALIDYCDRVDELGVQNWLYLHGPTSIGKSHLAQAIAHRVRENEAARLGTSGRLRGVAFVDWPEVMAQAEMSWNRERLKPEPDAQTLENDSQIWNRLLFTWFLVVDGIDIIPKGWTVWRVRQIYRLCEERERSGLPTVFTANADPSGLWAAWSDSGESQRLIDATYQRLTRRLSMEVMLTGTPYKF